MRKETALHAGLLRLCVKQDTLSFEAIATVSHHARPLLNRHPGEGRDLTLSKPRTGGIPAFAGTTLIPRKIEC
jgi:hypothetical protein